MIDLATPTLPARLGAPAVDRGSGHVFTGDWDGRPVLVRRLPGSPDRAVRARVDLLAGRLVGLDGPGLVPVLAVASDWEALDLIQASVPVLGSLASWSRRQPLRPGEVVGVGLGLAAALQHLHAHELTHGRLHAGDVLVAADGTVLLTGYGVAGVLGSAGTADDDVRDLVALLLLLCPDGAGGLRSLLRSSVATGADVADLLDVLHRCDVRPEALRVGGGAAGGRLPVPRPVPSRRGRTGRRLGARRPWRTFGRLLPAALGLVILAGWLGSRAVPEPSTVDEPAPPASPAATAAAPASDATPDWRAVVEELDRRRTALLVAPDPARVGDVDAPGSTAFASDAAQVRALQARGASARGAVTELVSVRVRTAGPARADLEVTDRLAAHTLVSRDGQVLERRPGRGARTTVLVLVHGDAGWRVAQVLAG